MIAGQGREESRLRKLAGATIEFRGRVSDEDLPELYANCRAFLFAANEDFGIVSVEAQAYGRPVLAYGKGGSLETVVGDSSNGLRTGMYFPSQTVEAMVECILAFEDVESTFDTEVIRSHAQQFDTALFRSRIQEFINSAIAARIPGP